MIRTNFPRHQGMVQAGEDRPGAITRRAAIALAGTAFLSSAYAQSYPVKPIKMVYPYAPGGGGDALVRLITREIGNRLGQTVVVESQPGANGSIGTANVVRAQPDGYTLLFTTGTAVVQNKLLRPLTYDTERDLTPIGKVGESPMMIVVNPKVPARTLGELIAYAKANPGKLKASNPGKGSLGHLTPLVIEGATGVEFNKIPYSTGQRLYDLLSGEIDMTIDTPTPYFQHFASGKLVGIAMMSKNRFSPMPNIPTTVESGFPNLLAEAWFAVFGPKDMPQDIVARINQAISQYLATPEGRSEMLGVGLIATPGTADALRSYVRSEFERWGPIIKSANISMD